MGKALARSVVFGPKILTTPRQGNFSLLTIVYFQKKVISIKNLGIEVPLNLS